MSPNKRGGGKLEKQYLRIRYKFILFIQIPGLINPFSTIIYFWNTEIIDSICLQILQLLRLKLAKIDKRGGPNEVRGIFKN